MLISFQVLGMCALAFAPACSSATQFLSDSKVPDSGATDSARNPDARASDAGSCTPGDYQGNPAWTAQLEVRSGARLCAYPALPITQVGDESLENAVQRLIADDLFRKSTLAFASGVYPLPTASTETAFRLPICVGGHDAFAVLASQRVSAETVSIGIGQASGEYVNASFPNGDTPLELSIYRALNADRAVLSPTPSASPTNGVTATRGDRRYVTCHVLPNNCWTSNFGTLGVWRLDEYGDAGSPGMSGLAIPLRLRGTIRGFDLDISGYENTSTIYGHHALARYIFFRYPQATNSACGIRFTTETGDLWTATETDCSGRPIGTPVAANSSSVSCEG